MKKPDQMIFFYKTIINILFAIVLPILPFVYLFSEKRRANMGLRLGIGKGFKKRKTGEKRIWVHALSVGEVISAAPFIKALKSEYKKLDIVFTASTKTGFDMAEQLFLKENEPLVDQLGYFPFDLGYCVKKISRRTAPDAVVLVETDLWPNFLYEMKKNKIPVILINARLSNRSLKGYLFFKKFSYLFFSSLTCVMAQTPLDEKRFHSLGLDKKKIVVTGNIKFDQPLPDIDKDYVEQLRARFGIQKNTKVIVAGSTHAGEEKILCSVYKKVKKKIPGLLMIIAPRDPKRCRALQADFLSWDVQTICLSKIDKDIEYDGPIECKKPGNHREVVLVDKMGELARLYSICDVAFIGGSMVARGGHNPLEPAAFSKPVLFGRDMSDFLQISTLLVDHGGAKRVESELELRTGLEDILENRQVQEDMGSKSFEVFSGNCGAVKRIINHMERLHLV